ncbi:ATP-binding protein [Roseobacter sp. N2S]|uniref:sensor histidine kinase n=1 Tax=Roseobacter sp. N2S TaxID=2663844 RepID=UPI0028584625|nr:ATP-binding protein [Roseobacter sp. N2S]MDR6263702.1 hypothetical protein [Roseobacter sp. N2S]
MADHYLKTELEHEMSVNPAMWQFVQEASLDGVWYWDLEQPDQEWMSPEFWKLFGIDPREKTHNPAEWQDIINPDDLKLALINFEQHCADSNHPYDQVVRYKHVDGSTIWVRCRGQAIRDGTGKAIRMLGVHNEITAVKRRYETGRELAAANSELRSFAYAVSHDLKSPVNTVSMLLAELLENERHALSKDGLDLVDLAGTSIKRMQVLIEDLLSYTSVIGEVVEFEPVALDVLAQDVLDDLRQDIENSGAEVDVSSLPKVIAHRTQMRLLLKNLIGNAVKYGKKEGGNKIKLFATVVDGNQVEINVQDNGIGIDEADFDKVFAVFGRLHRYEEYDGVGLGLALCRRIAMNHGGTITLQSKSGQGSCFAVRLPLMQN